MAVFNININGNEENLKFINDIYKTCVILTTLHILMYFSYKNNKITNFGFTGNLFNIEFVTFLIFVVISFLFYYLVANEILVFV
tara:strand:- start:11 stop:262 length:252 start_codon:yes stop_codon:yes gene_type:complete